MTPLTALREISNLKPEDLGEVFDEWGEAACFRRAQEIADETLTTYDDLLVAVDQALKALAPRWTRVDCTPEEEQTIRFLNDAMNRIRP